MKRKRTLGVEVHPWDVLKMHDDTLPYCDRHEYPKNRAACRVGVGLVKDRMNVMMESPLPYTPFTRNVLIVSSLVQASFFCRQKYYSAGEIDACILGANKLAEKIKRKLRRKK